MVVGFPKCRRWHSLIVSVQEVIEGARAADLADLPIFVHSSLSSFGCVENGADTIIDGLLQLGCTVVVPTFTSDFELQPPPERCLTRNAWNYDDQALDVRSDIFDPLQNYVSPGMGIIPSTLLRRRNRVRGSHPTNSMTALGPLAKEIVCGQTFLDVYAPIQKLADLGGKFLLMGVGLTAMTAIHLAERLSGRELFRRWAKGSSGQLNEIAVGSCSMGFDSLNNSVLSIESNLMVGASCWRILPAIPALRCFTDAISRDPYITSCERLICERCSDSIAGGPIIVQYKG